MFKSRSSEVDPLLPHNEPSPEIQTHGTRSYKGSSEIRYNSLPAYQRVEDEDYDDDPSKQPNKLSYSLSAAPRTNSVSDDVARSSACGTIVTFVTFAVFVAILLAALRSGDSSNGGSQPPAFGIPHPGSGHERNLTLDERASRILTDTPLIDGHNDLAIWIRGTIKNDIHSADFKEKFEHGGLGGNVDLQRLKNGMVGGSFWSAFVVCPENASTDFSDAEYSTAVSHTLQQIDMIKRLQNMFPRSFSAAGTSLADMLTRFHSLQAMFGPISIEGLHQVPQSAAMATLRLYYELGVRAATLTWNCHNAFADAALIYHNGTSKPAGYHRGGLTKAGREVIREMNRLGMLVDVSHTSYWTQKAVMSGGTSRSPIIFSHSSAFELCPHPRNVKDDVLALVKETKSVVMVNFTPDFISCTATDGDMPEFYPQNNTLHQVARHIVYIGEKIGYDYVGLGSDFDGMGQVAPKGLEGVNNFPDLVKELLKMGVDDADVSKIVGGNVLRVWQEVERVARKMQHDGDREGEDEVSGWYKELI